MLIYKNGVIGEAETNGLLYDKFQLEHLSASACHRLAQIHNEQPEINYWSAEAILIAEGLYQPEQVNE